MADTPSSTVSTRVPNSLLMEVDALATALRRNRAWVLHEALASYVKSETEFLKAIDEGIAAWKAGDLVEHEQILADSKRRHLSVKKRQARKPK